MLNQLLWRCPVCKIEDAIVHRRRRLRADVVHCTACSSAWELHRVRGGTDFRLKAATGPLAGVEHPLAEWYDMMREGFAPVPRSESAVALEPEEVLYLSGHPNLFAPRPDPRFREIIAKLSPLPPQEGAAPPPLIGPAGPCELFLTDRRLILHLSGNDQYYSMPLSTVRAVQMLIDRFLIIRHEKRLAEIFEFADESVLKWRAYLDAVLRPIVQAQGIQLHMAYD